MWIISQDRRIAINMTHIEKIKIEKNIYNYSMLIDNDCVGDFQTHEGALNEMGHIISDFNKDLNLYQIKED